MHSITLIWCVVHWCSNILCPWQYTQNEPEQKCTATIIAIVHYIYQQQPALGQRIQWHLYDEFLVCLSGIPFDCSFLSHRLRASANIQFRNQTAPYINMKCVKLFALHSFQFWNPYWQKPGKAFCWHKNVLKNMKLVCIGVGTTQTHTHTNRTEQIAQRKNQRHCIRIQRLTISSNINFLEAPNSNTIWVINYGLTWRDSMKWRR